MVTAKHKDRESAIREVVDQLAPRKYSMGDISPRNLERYAEGHRDMTYDVHVTLFEPKEEVIVPVELTNEDGDWKATTQNTTI